jgi:Uma2 family endonuclease
MTVEQYFAVRTDDNRMQLIDGEMVMNDPTWGHGRIQRRLLVALDAWTSAAAGRGEVALPVDVVLGEHDVYGPDLSWVTEEHIPEDPRKRLQRVPDLCVEIRSPSTWRYDVGHKKATYERHGLPELWLVDDVAETVLVYRRSAPGAGYDVALELRGDDVLASPQLPGFALRVADLFAR